jgi:hypothetical protein
LLSYGNIRVPEVNNCAFYAGHPVGLREITVDSQRYNFWDDETLTNHSFAAYAWLVG